MFWDNVIPLCPCSEYFAQMNGWWFTALEYNDFCYQSYIPYYRGGRVSYLFDNFAKKILTFKKISVLV